MRVLFVYFDRVLFFLLRILCFLGVLRCAVQQCTGFLDSLSAVSVCNAIRLWSCCCCCRILSHQTFCVTGESC